MISPAEIAQQTLESLAEQFFYLSTGNWRSERRYYTLKSGEIEEIVSMLTVRYLPAGSEELIQLERSHGLEQGNILVCGAKMTWESSYNHQPGRKPTSGATILGVKGNLLYRDRGFATTKPVTAEYTLRDSQTLQLRTEYGGSVFEEEIKLIGSDYRTRQTIISRAGEEIMIGQYLERRIG